MGHRRPERATATSTAAAVVAAPARDTAAPATAVRADGAGGATARGHPGGHRASCGAVRRHSADGEGDGVGSGGYKEKKEADA